MNGAKTFVSRHYNNAITRIANSRAVGAVSRGINYIGRGVSAVARPIASVTKPIVDLTKSTLSNAGSLIGGTAKASGRSVLGAARGLANSANNRLASSFVGKASSKLATKGATRLAGRLVKGGGPAALASLAIEGANMLGQSMGWWKEDSHTAKGMNIAGTTLGYAATGAMIGSFIPVIGNAVGGLVGGAIGLIKSTYENYGNQIKGFLFGKNNMSQASIAQQRYEETKLGMNAISESLQQDPSGESLKVLAAQATVKMHDLLVSIWYKMNGLQSDGTKADRGLLGGIGRFLTGGLIGGVSSLPPISSNNTEVVATNQTNTSVGETTTYAQANTNMATSSNVVMQMPNSELTDKAHQAIIDMLPILRDRKANSLTVTTLNASNLSYVASSNIENGTNVYTKVSNSSSNFGVKASDMSKPNIQSTPVVGLPTFIVPSYDISANLQPQPLDINLNVNGSIKLESSSVGGNKVDLDINKLLEDNSVKQKIIDIVIAEFSKVNGRTAGNSPFHKTRNFFIGMPYSLQ